MTGTRLVQNDPRRSIARDDITFGHVVNTIGVGSHARLGGAAANPDANLAITQGSDTGSVKPDGVASDNRAAHVEQQYAIACVAGDDVAFQVVCYAVAVGADTCVIRRNTESHAAVASMVWAGCRARDIGANIVARNDIAFSPHV